MKPGNPRVFPPRSARGLGPALVVMVGVVQAWTPRVASAGGLSPEAVQACLEGGGHGGSASGAESATHTGGPASRCGRTASCL